MYYSCCTEQRRIAIKKHFGLNGIDFLEVKDERQTKLYVHFLNDLDPASIGLNNILIKGGERVKNIVAINIFPVPEETPPVGKTNILGIEVNQPGDFSIYSLCLVKNNQSKEKTEVLEKFDPLLSKVDFSFKVACPTEFDCLNTVECQVEDDIPIPQINYLAKDYASFRQLMLDRMSLLVPDWKERNPADLGVTLVELLAYTADYLSYRQDATSTEAYLGTARKRISVSRHARLVDYYMHNGCNARAWIHIHVGNAVNGFLLKKGKDETIPKFFTKVPGLPSAFQLESAKFKTALEKAQVFELIHDIELFHDHNEMPFYTYGEEQCCLPKGSTRATLLGDFRYLKAGDFMVLAEVLNPETGRPEDADPKRKHVVRLKNVSIGNDIDIKHYLNLPDTQEKKKDLIPLIRLTHIEWHDEDALPFPLCISHKGKEGYFDNISMAYGNIALVDHGRTIHDTSESSLYPDTVPKIISHYVSAQNNQCHCEPQSQKPVPPRYHPIITEQPLTFSKPVEYNKDEDGNQLPHIADELSASALVSDFKKDALPSRMYLDEKDNNGIRIDNKRWFPKRDLLIDSGANDRHFVVEMERDSLAHLRFGNDQNGARPNEETRFLATYRIGNGPAGNVGAGVINHMAATSGITTALQDEELSIWNPLAATGGREAETIEEVKQYAPVAFRSQKRAVIPGDYEHFAKVCKPDVQRATSMMRWTGSWRTVFITVDRLEGKDMDTDFEDELRRCLDQYRMTGFDLEIDAPIPVSLEVGMEVCVKPEYFRGNVKKVLLEVFSNGTLPSGRRGFFHPDNFSFGQPVYLSQLYETAQDVQGVQSVKITKLQRQGDDNSSGIEEGELLFGRKEIARLDNDPNFPERGMIHFIMKGGR